MTVGIGVAACDAFDFLSTRVIRDVRQGTVWPDVIVASTRNVNYYRLILQKPKEDFHDQIGEAVSNGQCSMLAVFKSPS